MLMKWMDKKMLKVLLRWDTRRVAKACKTHKRQSLRVGRSALSPVNSGTWDTQWSTGEAGVQNNHIFNFSLGFTAKKITDSYCVLVTWLYNSSADGAPLFYGRAGGIRCRMKPTCDLASLPQGINDTDALSSLLLLQHNCQGRNHVHKRSANPYL